MHRFAHIAISNGLRPEDLAAAVTGLSQPMVFKGAVASWEAVKRSRQSLDSLIDYLKACDSGVAAETFRQMPDADGNYFYADDRLRPNFARAKVPLGATLARLRAPDAEPVYVQSAPLKDHMLRFKTENTLPGIEAEPRAWIGNRALTRTHFDLYYNLVCMVAGHKRFVLFPPDQVKNLYMGPIEATLSGVPVSMADPDHPDFVAYPRFAEALASAVEAALEPGDVLYIPYMWWHHVASLDGFNMQVNYWWNSAPAEMGPAMQALMHAMVSLRDLPPDQIAAWKAMFDHFVFHQSDPVADHLRPEVRGLLGALDPAQRIAIRKQIGRNLSDD